MNRYTLETLRRRHPSSGAAGDNSGSGDIGSGPSSLVDVPEPPILAVATVEADRLDLRASGQFGPGAAALVRDRLASLINAGARHLVIDFAEINHISSDVAKEFKSLEITVTKLGGSLRLI